MNIYLKKLVFKLGTRWRNPTLTKSLEYLANSETWTLEKLLLEQEKRLNDFFRHVYETREVYREHWGEKGRDLYNNWSKEGFQNIIACDKSFLIAENKRIHDDVSARNKSFFSETSGTSGQILTFSKGEEWDSFNRAFVFRALSWFNVQPWNYSLYFWGYNVSTFTRIKSNVQDFLVNRFRVFNYEDRGIIALKKRLSRASYIEGYSSVIYELAKMCKSDDSFPKNLKLIKGTSEKIYAHYHKATIQAFGLKIRSEYGAAESGVIATECTHGKMHLNVLGVYVEVDENNEILVTNLVSHSFPIVRYRLGDSVRLSEEKCSCGLEHPILEEVTGRVGKNIYGVRKKYASLTLYYIFKNLYFNHGIAVDYQVHQLTKGELEVWVKDDLKNKEQEALYKECYKFFANDMKITLKVKPIFYQESGKLKDFISFIDN